MRGGATGGEAEGQWALILGVSCGTGAAIARAVSEEPGLSIFGVHRGNHREAAAALACEIEARGRPVVLREADAGSAEGAAAGAEELLTRAGPRSVRLFVHSIACASVGRLAVGDAPLHPRQVQRTLDAMASSFVFWARELVARDLLAPGARLLGLSNPTRPWTPRRCPGPVSGCSRGWTRPRPGACRR